MNHRSKLLAVSVVLSSLGLMGGTADAATHGSDSGGCPDGFMPHHAHTAHDHGDHRVAGTLSDRNGDGQLCVKHVGGGRVHVHIDNNARP